MSCAFCFSFAHRSTYEIEAKTRQTYELFDFPFDMQDVEIVVRLDSHRGDPLKRHIVPLCHDKAFFCSSRVPPLTEWRVTRNLDWHVERGARGNEGQYGDTEGPECADDHDHDGGQAEVLSEEQGEELDRHA